MYKLRHVSKQKRKSFCKARCNWK